MGRDYSKAWQASDANAKAHLRAAQSLLTEGRPGFAVAHAALGFEEAAKAVYCSMVSNGYLMEKDIELVFREHNPKAFLYEEVFNEGLVVSKESSGLLVKVNQEQLADRVKKSVRRAVRKSLLEQHGQTKQRGLYVDWAGERVSSPQEATGEEARKLVDDYEGKTVALLAFAFMLNSSVKEILSKQKNTEIGPFRLVRQDPKTGEVIVSYSWS